MPDSPPPELSHGEIKENWVTPKRPCDFCNEATALLYCRADTAKLCLSCDREVHSTNQLFTKHTRSLLCDACDSSPASIFCSTDAAVHCQNCDWEAHTKSNSNSNSNSNSSSATHDRRPLEGFTGCPSVTDLLAIFGFEDLSKKGLFSLGGVGGDGSDSYDGFSDYLVWETPTFVTLDDLIVSSGPHHNYQAMGVPPLPKNRNAACGAYKDELLRQLRKMAKLEPNVDGDEELIKASCEFKPMVPTHDIQLQDTSAGILHKSEQNMYSSDEMNAFKWCYDKVDFGDQEFPSNQIQGYNIEANSFVPEKESDIVNSSSNTNACHEGQLHHAGAADNAQVFPPAVVVRELNSQERDSAISRYKEKKKSRRYDKHIRYESRKVRAESRTRIRGRFAKMDR